MSRKSNEHKAIKQASLSTFRQQVGAIIVKGGNVISTGYNKTRYSKKTGKKWTSIHAEEDAILSAMAKPNGLKRLAGSTLYVSRILKNGQTALAKPCATCQQLINAVHIKKVIHT